jgi:hypothetical protein
MSLQYRFTPVHGIAGGADRMDIQSRVPLNLMNMRDSRAESPHSVGILMSAFSRNPGLPGAEINGSQINIPAAHPDYAQALMSGVSQVFQMQNSNNG